MRIRPARRVAGLERTLIRQIFDSAPADAINLGLGQPDLPTPDVAALHGVAAISAGRTSYTSTAGDPELREALAQRYRPFARDPDNVLVTVGSQEAMYVACLGLLDSGDEVLYPDPGYPAYPVVAGLVGARPVAYPLRPGRRFRLDPEDVVARLTEHTRAVILCAPSNPTGASIQQRELEQLTRVLEQRGVPWISDEIYSGFSYDEPFVSPADVAPDGGLVISGLSKDLSMTGWRVGWIVGPREILTRLIAIHQYLVTCASSISQRAALAAFTPTGIAIRKQYLEIFRARRDLMAQELGRLAGVEFTPPDGAFYFYVDVSRYGDSVQLARRLLERAKVVTVPGEAFGNNGKGYLRISFAASNDAIREGLQRIRRELAQ